VSFTASRTSAHWFGGAIVSFSEYALCLVRPDLDGTQSRKLVTELPGIAHTDMHSLDRLTRRHA